MGTSDRCAVLVGDTAGRKRLVWQMIGVNRTKVRKVSQDFSIISYINMLGDWQLLGFVAFPSTFGGHIFFATHCQIWHLKSCETLRTFVRFTPMIQFRR